jgi:hypothetical protein
MTTLYTTTDLISVFGSAQTYINKIPQTDPAGDANSVIMSMAYGIPAPMSNPEDGTQGVSAPPDRADMNGILQLLTFFLNQLQQGMQFRFQNYANAGYSSWTGYPQNAILAYQRPDLSMGWCYSLVTNNTNSPELQTLPNAYWADCAVGGVVVDTQALQSWHVQFGASSND